MSFVQFWGDDSGPAIATSGSNVTSGNVICGIIFWNSTTITLTSIANNRGPNCTLLGNPTAMPLNGMRVAMFYGELTSGGATCTLTSTFSSSPTVAAIFAHEYSGIDTAQIVDNAGAAWALQEFNGAGNGGVADYFTSGNLTTVTNGCTVVGLCMDPNINNDMTSGTGFTDRSTTQSVDIRADSEDRVQTTAGVIAATFTCANNFRVTAVGGIGLKPPTVPDVPGPALWVTRSGIRLS
jgi:hypothetical protein